MKLKSLYLGSALMVAGLFVVIGFQNCAPQTGGPGGSSSSSVDSVDGLSAQSSKIQVDILASEAVKIDCSLDAGQYRYEIMNAGSDILLCQQYSLDMPVNSPRRGEVRLCDSPEKFSAPQAGWNYDAAARTWSREAATKNHQSLVPGDFTLFVKDGQGNVYSSNLLRVRRNGATNCQVAETPAASATTPTVTATKVCAWVGDDFSPTVGPASQCSEQRVNTVEKNIYGADYTCTCVMKTSSAPSMGGSVGSVIPSPSVQMTNKCNPAGTTLKIINSKYIVGMNSFPRTYFYPQNPSEILTFAFKTSSDTSSGKMNVAPTGTNYPGYEIFVSECPGTLDKSRVDIGCYGRGVEAVGTTFIVNRTWEQIIASAPGLSRGAHCLLKPNTQYYFTVRPSTTSPNPCRDSASCAFSSAAN